MIVCLERAIDGSSPALLKKVVDSKHCAPVRGRSELKRVGFLGC